MFRPRERAFQQFKCPRPQCVKRNIEGSSSNNYCSAKAISIVYSECVFVALGVQGEMRMRHIVICTNDHVEANKYFDNRNQFYQRAVKTHRRATP